MDLNQLKEQIVRAINDGVDRLNNYFSSLNQNETYAWMIILGGLFLFVIGLAFL